MATKQCKVCGKDVSQVKRVKDPAGNYYCEPCHVAGMRAAGLPVAQAAAAPVAVPVAGPARQPAVARPAPQPVAVAPAEDDDLALKDEIPLKDEPRRPAARVTDAPPAPMKKPAPAFDDDAGDLAVKDEYDLKDEPPAKPARQPAPAGTALPAAGPPADLSKLPEQCPFCGLKVVTKSRYCLGCRRDMLDTEKLAKIMQDASQEDKAQKIGKVAGKIIGAVVGLVILIVVGLVAWGQIQGMIGPGDVFAEYPTSRDQLVKSFLANLNGGTDKDYEKALKLISQRETGVTNQLMDGFKAELIRFREQLIKENGADWYSKAQVSFPQADQYLGDEVFAEVKIDKKIYHIGMQAQIGVDRAVAERHIPLKKKTPYRENGKLHWGIGEIQEHHLVDPIERKMYRPGSDAPDVEDDKPWVPQM